MPPFDASWVDAPDYQRPLSALADAGWLASGDGGGTVYTRPQAQQSDAGWQGAAPYTRLPAGEADALWQSVGAPAYERPPAQGADASWLGADAYTRTQPQEADAEWIAESTGPGGPARTLHFSHVLADAVFDGVLDFTYVQNVRMNAQLEGATPHISLDHDFSAIADAAVVQTRYTAELVGPGGIFPLPPISSWQSTVQADRQSFLQVVVPAADTVIDAILARKGWQLVVHRVALFSTGASPRQEITRTLLQTVRYDRGPTRATAVLSGYADLGFTVLPVPTYPVLFLPQTGSDPPWLYLGDRFQVELPALAAGQNLSASFARTRMLDALGGSPGGTVTMEFRFLSVDQDFAEFRVHVIPVSGDSNTASGGPVFSENYDVRDADVGSDVWHTLQFQIAEGNREVELLALLHRTAGYSGAGAAVEVRKLELNGLDLLEIPEEDKPSNVVRTLRGVRSVSTDGANDIRIRAAIDWRLRPGELVDAGGQLFRARFMNFIVTREQEFMDIGGV